MSIYLLDNPENPTPFHRANFFIMVPPGFEELARAEFYEKLDLYFPDCEYPEIVVVKGGLEMTWELIKGCSANRFLKIPNRILLRLDEFKCRDFPKLYNKIQKYNWKYFLYDAKFTISATSHQSRLFHSKRIEKSVALGIEKFFKNNPPKKKMVEQSLELPEQMIYVRFNQDVCTLSIDTSGIRLGMRGSKIFSSLAPIRENLAAGLVYGLSRFVQNTEDNNLIDPMCGSGTHLFEAQGFYDLNEARRYHYNHWPLMENVDSEMAEHFRPKLYKNLIGLDVESKNIETCQNNLSNLSQTINDKSELSSFSFQQKDVFLEGPPTYEGTNIVIINPPYGKRIAPYSQLEDYYRDLFCACQRQYSPKLLGMTIPTHFSYRRILIKNYKLVDQIVFSNGGIRVHFLIFKLMQSR